MEDELKEMLAQSMAVIEGMMEHMVKDGKLINLMASVCRKYYLALISEGFTDDQAVGLVERYSANLGQSK